LGSLAGGDRADRDVAIGNHADEKVVLRHGDRADIVSRHRPGALGDGLLRTADAHVARHGFAHSHETATHGAAGQFPGGAPTAEALLSMPFSCHEAFASATLQSRNDSTRRKLE